jgi:hypothetical protein
LREIVKGISEFISILPGRPVPLPEHALPDQSLEISAFEFLSAKKRPRPDGRDRLDVFR